MGDHRVQKVSLLHNGIVVCLIYDAEKLTELSEEVGFEVIVNGYIQKETVNHKENICAPRIFIQAKLRKPMIIP